MDFHGIPLRYFTQDCFQFLLGVEIAPRETENNPYAKFGGDKQRALWYVMVFSGVVNAKCTHDHSIFRTIDGSTRELLAKQLKKKIPKSPTIYGQPLLTFAERAVVGFE